MIPGEGIKCFKQATGSVLQWEASEGSCSTEHQN